MTKIEELKSLSPQERSVAIEGLFKKNKEFFAKINPAVAKVIKPSGIAPYKISMTDDFLKIVDKKTGELCHPEIGLDKFAMVLGDWTNNVWIDLIEGKAQKRAFYGKYSQFPLLFHRGLLQKFPGLLPRIKERQINLPALPDGRSFSNATVFVGVFHGLHIDYYLSRTELSNAAFIEPDTSRFVLSCYFLDYEALHERFDGLILHVGNEFPSNHIDRFFRKSHLSAPVWVRVLPGYASDKVEPLMRQFRLKWRNQYDVWIPAEWHLEAMRHTMENLSNGKKIYAEQQPLSRRSRIAVVGSGPSLSADLPWLKQHQDQMIIFAAHSAVSALQQAEIQPDFQFNIEVRQWSDDLVTRLQLDPSIPIVTMVGDVPDKFAGYDEVLMLPEDGGVHPVKFTARVPYLSPTTGNTAVGFACRCKPKELFLFGLDFGFREAGKTHVKESVFYQDEKSQKSQLGSNNVEVPANFSGSDAVYTQPYFNLARQHVEMAIKAAGQEIKVHNCSDGARIVGAKPRRSRTISAMPYDKAGDVAAIRAMFIPLEQGVHWHPCELDGAEQLEAYKAAIPEALKMPVFDWSEFTRTIDNLRVEVEKTLPEHIAKNRDLRISAYFTVINDLLITWYRLLCFTNNEQEWQRVYEFGYEVFKRVIDEFEWPEGL